MEGYRVIARRWRPKRFEDLVGQDPIVRTLSNAIRSQRIAHAYLFVGPRGTGKTSTARLFAMALNCENGPSLDFNPESPRCQAILKGTSMDVIEIDGASNNSVEQIRSLREECHYAPAESPFKVYILDEVHMLSNAAFNALLKTLEEPPPHVKFIFATTEVHKVPATILSRCQHFEFYPLNEETIFARLKRIVTSEDILVEEKALHLIAKLAEGGMRDAQSMLDQMVAFGNGNVTEKDIRSMYGLLEEDTLQSLANAIEQGDYATLLHCTEQMVSSGNDSYRALLDLQKTFRERFLKTLNGVKKSTEAALTPSVYAKLLDVLKTGEEDVQKGLSVRVNFEAVLFKAVECVKFRSLDHLLELLNEQTAKSADPFSNKEIKKNDP